MSLQVYDEERETGERDAEELLGAERRRLG